MNTLRGLKVALVLLTVLTVATTVTGCKRKKPAGINTGMGTTGTSTTPESTTGTGLPNANLESLQWVALEGARPVYFDYDSSALRGDAIETLKENARIMKETPNQRIQIEGHCDERGTQEYNLALGERRALAVREFLINLGVSGDRLLTVSYGEEKPAEDGHDESAWRMNRRAEFNRSL
jgi:peptidoglycan-associated lipoprotein